jgi:hypothetical protein
MDKMDLYKVEPMFFCGLFSQSRRTGLPPHLGLTLSNESRLEEAKACSQGRKPLVAINTHVAPNGAADPFDEIVKIAKKPTFTFFANFFANTIKIIKNSLL